MRPQLPEKPSFVPVVFIKKDGFYCLDADDAKNLIYNIEMLKTYADDLLLNIQATR